MVVGGRVRDQLLPLSCQLASSHPPLLHFPFFFISSVFLYLYLKRDLLIESTLVCHSVRTRSSHHQDREDARESTITQFLRYPSRLGQHFTALLSTTTTYPPASESPHLPEAA